MSSELKYWYLKEHKLFRNLSFSEIDALCILKRFKHSKKSETIELPNSEKPRIYFLKHGAIKLIKIDKGGEEVVLDFLKKGDIFGELSLESASSNDETYIKVLTDDAIICTFYKENLEELMMKKPDFALSYVKFIGFNYKKIKNNYSNIFFKDAKSRLVLFINDLLDENEIKDNVFLLPNYLTQKDIAQLICTTRQTIITLFKDLEKDGLLSYSAKEIHILNVEAIKNIAENVR